MKFGRMLVLSFAAMIVAAPAVYAQDDDLGELTTKKPARRQTVEEENNDPSRSGPMLGFGATYAHANFDGVGKSASTTPAGQGQNEIEARDSGGYNAHLGYRFNRWTASDLDIERYQKFNASGGHGHNDDVGQVNGWALGIDQKVYFLPGRIQPLALIGLNYLSMETNVNNASNKNKTDDGAALRFGIGLDAYVTNKLVLTTGVSYMLGVGQVDGYDMVLVGLGFLYRP